MKISCLMATSGRHAHVENSIAMFLAQDIDHDAAELIILNNNDTPLTLHPDACRNPRDGQARTIRVYNEPGYPTLGHVRQRLAELATGEFCRTWDNDDLFMPFSLSQGLERIGRADAFKPKRSWWYDGNGMGTGKRREPCFELAENAMEASITFRTQFVRTHGYRLGQGDEHASLLAALGDRLATSDLGDFTGYCYMWQASPGGFQASQTLQGNTYTSEERAADWQARQTDVRPGVPLRPAFDRVYQWWVRMLEYISPENREEWERRVFGVWPHERPDPEPQPIPSTDLDGNPFPVSWGGYDAAAVQPDVVIDADTAAATCRHERFRSGVNVHRDESNAAKTRYRAELAITCADCGLPFSFVGLPPGYNQFGAACSEDTLEGRFAIRPGKQ